MCAVNEGLTKKKEEVGSHACFSLEVLLSPYVRLCVLFGSPQESRNTVGTKPFLFFPTLPAFQPWVFHTPPHYSGMNPCLNSACLFPACSSSGGQQAETKEEGHRESHFGAPWRKSWKGNLPQKEKLPVWNPPLHMLSFNPVLKEEIASKAKSCSMGQSDVTASLRVQVVLSKKFLPAELTGCSSRKSRLGSRRVFLLNPTQMVPCLLHAHQCKENYMFHL